VGIGALGPRWWQDSRWVLGSWRTVVGPGSWADSRWVLGRWSWAVEDTRWVLGRWVLGRWVLGSWDDTRWVLGRWVLGGSTGDGLVRDPGLQLVVTLRCKLDHVRQEHTVGRTIGRSWLKNPLNGYPFEEMSYTGLNGSTISGTDIDTGELGLNLEGPACTSLLVDESQYGE